MSADKFIFENALEEQENNEYFKSKHFTYVNDSSNGGYGATNQVTIDLTGLANQDRFVNPAEMYLVVPLVTVLSTDGVITKNNDFAVGFKNGYHNLISSMQIEYHEKSVQQLVTNINQYVSFKKMTEMSLDKLENDGLVNCFFPDNATSWSYNKGPDDAYGNGFRNNNNEPSLNKINKYVGDGYNNGFLKRQMKTSFNIDKLTGLRTEAQIRTELKDYTKTNLSTNSNGTGYQVWYQNAIIKLADISSFFKVMPLVKGFSAKVILNFNLGSLKLTLDGNKPTDSKVSLTTGVKEATTMYLNGSNIQFPNGCCPIMVGPVGKALFVSGSEAVIGCYIAKPLASLGTISQNNLNIESHSLPTCRIYAPIIDMIADAKNKYLSTPTKEIVWEDYYYTQLTNLTKGQTINYNITNSVFGIKGILAIPMMAAAEHGKSSTNTIGFSPLVSPFTGEGACTGPLGISNWNVQLSGENVLKNFGNYSFELFNDEIHKLGVDGNLSPIVSSLISLDGFENIYRYYYCDLSRREPDLKMGKSVTICGVNNNECSMDLFIYVIFEKKGIISVNDGKLTM